MNSKPQHWEHQRRYVCWKSQRSVDVIARSIEQPLDLKMNSKLCQSSAVFKSSAISAGCSISSLSADTCLLHDACFSFLTRILAAYLLIALLSCSKISPVTEHNVARGKCRQSFNLFFFFSESTIKFKNSPSYLATPTHSTPCTVSLWLKCFMVPSFVCPV